MRGVMRVDIDIERMKMDILRRQQEAVKPFQEELWRLEILERLVESNGVAPRREPKAGMKPKRVRANGGLPYAGLTQPEALREILGKEPNLKVSEITERMEAGGYPFQTSKPRTSVFALVHDMTQRGELKMIQAKSRLGGERNRYRLA